MSPIGARVVVVGTGIGGLAAATGLLAAGMQVVVLERRPSLAQMQSGGGLHLWHNGARALAELGLAGPVRDLAAGGARLETAQFCSSDGTVLAAWPVERIERELGAPTVGVGRGQLHALLLDRVADAELHMGVACTGFAQDDRHVRVHLSTGKVLTADALIGADGLHSVVRRELLGERPPRAAGYASWQAIVDLQRELAPVGLFRVLWGPGARFLFYRLSDRQLYWEGQFTAAPGGRDPAGARRDAALRRFAGYAHPVAAIIAATPESAITRLDVYDRAPVHAWGTGRVTLLGDAAHPMTNAIGQGANQALEDAVVLGSLVRSAGSWPEALRSYEAQRRPRTTSMVRTARSLQRLNHWRSPMACLVRDQLIRGGFRIALRKHAADMAVAF